MWDVQLNDPCRTPPPPSISILLLAHTRQRVGVQAADSVNDVCVVICTRMWGWPRQFARRTPSSKSGLVCPWPLELARTVASASYVFSTFTPACVVGLTTKSRREMDNMNVWMPGFATPSSIAAGRYSRRCVLYFVKMEYAACVGIRVSGVIPESALRASLSGQREEFTRSSSRAFQPRTRDLLHSRPSSGYPPWTIAVLSYILSL